MALKAREQMLVGLLLLGGAAYLLFMVGGEQFGKLQTNMTTISSAQGTIESLTTQENTLRSEVTTLKAAGLLPPGIHVRKIPPTESLETLVKDTLDQVVSFASRNNNKLIRLEPTDAPPIVPPPPPPEPTASGAPAPETAEEAPVSPIISVGYKLALRGTYATIQDFLREVDRNKDLVEVYSVVLINEQGPARGKNGATASGDQDILGKPELFDPSKPIEMNAVLRLVFER
ncbi:MAG: hypothetical protein AB7P76_12800 [Candidatus Melainabacteria bacterium]